MQIYIHAAEAIPNNQVAGRLDDSLYVGIGRLMFLSCLTLLRLVKLLLVQNEVGSLESSEPLPGLRRLTR